MVRFHGDIRRGDLCGSESSRIYLHIFEVNMNGNLHSVPVCELQVGYDLCPNVSLSEIVRQVRLAVAFTARKFPGHRLVIAGHSAGGHLGAMALATDWSAGGLLPELATEHLAGLPVLAGALLVSGVFDLEPIRLSENNKPLGMDQAEAVANSPLSSELVAAVARSGAQVSLSWISSHEYTIVI
jgi:hypothetical protein